MGDFNIVEKLPSIDKYIKLRKEVGWETVDIETAKRGINNSNYCICIECEGNLIGFGRVVGDGATVFYIHDIMVSPKYQKQKLGLKIMEKVMEYIYINYSDKAFIGLIAKHDLDKFYSKFGFSYNENNRFYRFKIQNN
ncbi:GNAT family N-acetyltransferase [Clostridium sp.]|uniref:GNAT family N-acetyltransferase n=1 Tax=Clostridium sp. TaxID=1506 RepID=UPI002850F4F6|nr:GNAT family N-acetyltransferase [Clostridium sp.]MDR3598032.1 GNAT family N-acetyltransferase [Clostridium sp.]